MAAFQGIPALRSPRLGADFAQVDSTLGDPTLSPKEQFRAAYERLHEVAEAMKADLVSDLAADMSATVDDIDEAIEFVSDNSPDPMTRDEMIIHSQIWPIAFTDGTKEFAREKGCEEQTVGGYVQWLAQNFPWPVRRDPIPNWRSRLEGLKNEADEHLALKKYCDFMNQTEKIRSALAESAAQLDGHIQQQIDFARGK